jgi:hypothetical protein
MEGTLTPAARVPPEVLRGIYRPAIAGRTTLRSVDLAHAVSIPVAVATGLLVLLRLLRGRGVNTWTYVLLNALFGSALLVSFAEEAAGALLGGILAFIGFGVSAWLWDTWLYRDD